MVDRTDIDALLISALYGELTPADEARLTAHLESHPADRTALADLTRTRATVRDSRLLAVQLEPPQSVSAMLLREAARRVPRQAREDAGWFHRFVRSFMAHPAMAAAAMLVLVVGVAGTIYVRNGLQYAAPSLDSADDRAPVASSTPAAPSSPPSPASPSPAEPTGGASAVAPEVADLTRSDQSAGSSAHTGTYQAGLAENEKAGAGARGEPPTGAMKDSAALELSKEEGRGDASNFKFAAPAKPAAAPAKLAKKGNSGIEMRRPELQPKDLDDEKQERAKADVGGRGVDRARDGAFATNDEQAINKLQQAPGGGPAGGRTVTAAADRPQDPAAAAHKPSPSDDSAPASGAKAKSPAPAKSMAPPSPKTVARSAAPEPPVPAQASPPPPPPPAASSVIAAQRENRSADKAAPPAEARTETKAAEDKLLDWAKKQHNQVIAFVSANKCREAATAAIAIYSRAPGYYASNVATDRSIKPCLPYLTSEREVEDRRRAAAKRATAADSIDATESPPARK